MKVCLAREGGLWERRGGDGEMGYGGDQRAKEDRGRVRVRVSSRKRNQRRLPL
jgi:hypothetical protein